MPLDREKIMKLAGQKETASAGERLYQSGRVKILNVDRFWRGEQLFHVEVSDGGEIFPVTFQLCQGEPGRLTCACQENRNGICRHLVAAAFAVLEYNRMLLAPHISTSEEVRELLGDYANRRLSRELTKGETESLYLEPLFLREEDGLRLGLYLCGSYRVRIRDLKEFARAIDRGLPFWHSARQAEIYLSEEQFGKADRAFMHLVCDLILHRDEHERQISTSEDSILLSVTELDQVIECLMEAGYPGEPKLKDEEPRLTLVIEPAGRDGISLRVPQPYWTAGGGGRFYLCTGGILYRTRGRFADSAGRFLSALEKSGKRQELFLQNRDISGFYDYYKNELESAFVTEFHGVDLEEYRPQPFTAEFFADCPQANELTLSVRYHYGEIEVSPFDYTVREGLIRDTAGERLIAEVIKRYFRARYAARECFAIQNNDAEIYRFLREGVRELSELGEVHLSERVQNMRILPAPRVSIGVVQRGDWFDLRVDAEGLSDQELAEVLTRYRRKESFIRLESGSFLQLDSRETAALAELYDSLEADRGGESDMLSLPAWRALYVDNLRERMSATLHAPEGFTTLLKRLKNAPEAVFAIPQELKNVMLDYQKQGFSWMKTLDHLGFGGILADEMGLGKTLQAISLLVSETQTEKKSVSLIVCPASLVYNWKHEIETYAPGLSSVAVAGETSERESILSRTAGQIAAGEEGVQVLITSYDLLKRDLHLYRELRFRYCFLDEAQYIKNHQTQNARAVKQLTAISRFALTGTPIENRLSELWSIMDFLMPGLLYGYSRFSREIEQPVVKEQSEEALDRLHRMIGPFILRRLKKDVLTELPDKLETVLYSQMEGEQRSLYAANAIALRDRLTGSDDARYHRERMQVLAELTRLRQICCDPALYYSNYHGGSAKLEACLELIASSIQGGHKILLFSQFTSMLERIGSRLKEQGIHYYELTGRTGKRERTELADRFNEDDVPVFLISLKAGGTGLNLTAADVVIHYDPWWNVAAQNQATDRAHRLGQQHVVSVFKLITRLTIEENILLLQENKKQLAEKMMEGGDGAAAGISREDLIALLEERRMEDELY